MKGRLGSSVGGGAQPNLGTTNVVSFTTGNFNPRELKSISEDAGGFCDKCIGWYDFFFRRELSVIMRFSIATNLGLNSLDTNILYDVIL